MKPHRVLGIIMAGGKGERLLPLTEVRSKPAVPFGGKYRIIDFVLSNFVNSDITSLYVLVQYRSQSLIEHLRKSWQLGGRLSHSFVSVVPSCAVVKSMRSPSMERRPSPVGWCIVALPIRWACWRAWLPS